ncbi:calcium-binding protein [Cupriavidus sp. L7L]|uniref:calcium-binding protein n=1 Tax=Cupriavidus sp. L7L TaxID=2546443 RepID=UPI001056AD5C|nr:calcium-binding protein [Cupriavidus sp. L7L]TDF62000.1 calcium-binding protein [Cupriavidus sp. L7L]
MTKRVLVTGALLAAVFVAGQAGAQQQPQAQPAQPAQPTQPAQPQKPMTAQEMKAAFAEKFKAADTDNDGKLTRQEAEAGMPEVAKNFDKIDRKKTGYVTQKQVGSYAVAKAKQRKTAQDPSSLN